MALRINIVQVPATGFAPLDVTPDTDTAGLAQLGGQGLELKNEGQVAVRIFDSRKDGLNYRTLDPGEPWAVDLDSGDHLFGQAVGSAGTLSVSQVGVAAT